METEKIIEIISEFVDVDGMEINDSTRIRNDIGLNSFDLINVAVELESAFGVRIPDEDLNKLQTIGDIKALLG